MYKNSKKEEHVVAPKLTNFACGSRKIKLNLAYSNKSRVIKSPYYRGFFLWNQLDYNIQHIGGESIFSKVVRRLDVSKMKIYEDG